MNRGFVLANILLAGLYFYAISLGFIPGNHFLFYLLIGGEAYHLLQTISYCYTIWQRRPPAKPTELFIAPVDVFITVCGEPLDEIAQTIRAAKAMDYPSFTIYVLNDGYVAKKSNWHAVTKLAKELDVKCITRRKPGGAKAGNINRALKSSRSPYVAVFDADHQPYPNFLKEVMSHFDDANVGFVQTPQYYRNQRASLVAKTAWRQQTLFFGPIMSGKNRHNAAFMCGTNMVVRRQALRSVGGMNEDNIVEDFLTSLQIHSKGWRSVYIPKILAEGLAPEDFQSYYKQQYRWARGSLGVLLKHNILLRRGLTIRQRLQYLSSAFYYLSGIVVLIDALLPLIFLYTGITAVNTSSMALAAVFLPAIVFNLYTLQATNGFSYDFRAISFSLSSFGIQLTALAAAVFNRKTKFSVTSKRRITGNFWRYVIPHFMYIVASVAGIIVGFVREGISASLLANVAWVVVNVGAFLPFIIAATGWRSPFVSHRATRRPVLNKRIKVTAVLASCMVGVCLISYFALLHASIRLDESQSLLQVNQSVGNVLHAVAYDNHVPLYHLLLHFWLLAFGNNITNARLMSLAIFLLIIPMVYLLARRVVSINWALFVTVLVSFSPFMNWYANEARMYTILALMMLINQYFFIGILQKGKGWLGFAVSSMIGIFAHYFFCLGLLIEGVFILARLRHLPKGSFKRLAIITALICIEFAPWLWYFHLLGSGNETPLLPKPSTVDLFNVFSQFSFGFQDNFVNTILVSLWPLLTIAALVAVKNRRRFTGELGYLLAAGLLPVLAAFAISVFIQPLFISRYLIFCLAPLTIVLVWFMGQLARRAAVTAAAVVLLLVGVTSVQEYASPATPVKEDYRSAVRRIDSKVQANDVVVVTAPFTLYPVDYYYRGAAPVALLPDSPIKPLPGADGVPVGKQVALATHNAATAYVLASYNQGQQSEIIRYFQKHYKQTYAQQFSSDLTLYTFRINGITERPIPAIGEAKSTKPAS